MLQNTQTENLVKRSFSQWDLVDTRLEQASSVSSCVVARRSFNREAQIKRNDVRARIQGNLRKTTGTASRLEDYLAVHTRRPARGCVEPVPGQIVVHHGIDLEFIEPVPLKTE